MTIARRKLLKSGLALLAAGQLSRTAWAAEPAPPATAPAVAAEKIEVKSTLENLTAAFNGESNASARYTAFARKADEEGYGKVASLFRAAAKAESIHAKNHLEAIKKMGGQSLKPDLKPPEVKSTKENLEAALKGETYEFKVMYPAFLAKARPEKRKEVISTMTWAGKVETGHAKLYQEALANLDAWKGPNVPFYVCGICGNTVTKIDFTKCPVCLHPRQEYIMVK